MDENLNENDLPLLQLGETYENEIPSLEARELTDVASPLVDFKLMGRRQGFNEEMGSPDEGNNGKITMDRVMK